MQARILVGPLALAALFGAPAGPAGAGTCGDDEACGVPSCWDASVRTRPNVSRELGISCRGAVSARVLREPGHGAISDVSTEWPGLRFTLRADEDAPRHDEALFEVKGPEGSLELPVPIEVVPMSENSAPVCEGDRVSLRSDGTGPVDVFMHPRCHDPDLDDFTVHGGGPGTHPESPKAVLAGWTEQNWPYRTATHAGSETAPIWAVDSLGARSADAALEVTVGPDVNSPPTCRPNPWYWTADGVAPVSARPGAIRRFGLVCEDADADPFTPALSSPPERGAMPVFLVGGPQHGFWGVERWIDATYVPVDDSLEPDPFSVTAAGANGSGPAARMAIVPVGLPENGGGGCGYSPAQVTMDLPGTVELTCDDAEGDPLSAEVVDGPLHGTTGPAAITPARYGGSTISIPYVPDPGHLGYDCVKVVVTDGHGASMKLTVDIFVVRPSVALPPVALPPLPDVTTVPVPRPPGPPGAGSTSEPARAFAQRALGTTGVKRVRSPAGAEVWAPKKLSKRALLRRRRAASLFVLCRARCTVRSDSKLLTGRRARATRRRTVVAATPDAGQILWLGIDSAQGKALRRARSARFALDVRLRMGRVKGAAVRHLIRVGR